MRGEAERPLAELVRGLTGVRVPPEAARVRIRGIAADTRQLRAGELFVAIPGAARDGHAYIGEAVAAEAAAVVVERDVGPLPVPVVRVEDARAALAELAAAWYGRPAERLSLIGITGSLGKTSVLAMLESILAAGGGRIGTIGSLGVHPGGEVEPSRLTTPDALTLQHALARVAESGAPLAAMEVTSHALDQRRVHGLSFDLGIFTNLVLLEHLEYHGSFRSYVAAKTRFFDHLRAGAPLVYPAGDRAVRALVRGRAIVPVSCGAGGRVSLQTERLRLDRGGTRVVVTVRRALPRLDGGVFAPASFTLALQVLGRPNVGNAALAATAALCLGAEVEVVQRALAAFPAPWRRMQIVHRGEFTVLDDTVGHPDSISAVFEVARKIRHRRLHVVYAVRGRRGAEINRQDAETVAIWTRRVPVAVLLVTSGTDAADEANRVQPAEREAFVGQLRRYGVPHRHHDRLADAVAAALDRVGPGDLLLLLGAQGMNRGTEWLRRLLG